MKPCPFCGKTEPVVDIWDCVEAGYHETCVDEGYDCSKQVVCDMQKGGCGASARWAPTDATAIEAWEKRA